MKKRVKKFIITSVALPALLIFAIIAATSTVMSYIGDKANDGSDIEVAATYEEGVEQYREIIEKCCKDYNNQTDKLDLEKYVDLALAIMTVESHGAGLDPMQASECGYNTKYPNKPNGITDPEYSCQCGVQYMRDALIMAKVKSPSDLDHIGVACQGYNFGMTGWINWINKHGGKYTLELAQKYSDECMPANAKGTPSHAKKILAVYFVQDTSETNTDVASVINLSEADAWKQITGKNITSKPSVGSIQADDMKSHLSTIQVTVWDWKDSGNTTDLKKKKVTKSITVNTLLTEYFKNFFEDMLKEGIIVHDLGSYCFRTNTPGTALSAHSFGVAIDINATTTGNGYGQQPYTKKKWEKLAENHTKYETIYVDSPLVKLAKKYTLNWGGSWKTTKDGMHFSFVGDGKTREELRKQK